MENLKNQQSIRNTQFSVVQHESKFVTEIFRHIKDEKDENRSFLTWLELYLDNCSRKVRRSIENAYYLKRKQVIPIGLSNDPTSGQAAHNPKKALRDLRNDLVTVSFGLEHIVREFGQLFEAVECYLRVKSNQLPKEHEDILELPKIIADLMLQGIPFEIMDGDTSFIPTIWVRAVFEEMKKSIGDKKLFVVSVVGTQSSGKSTLLNTMFGLKFAVSAGRCTKGLYCVMIPVDKQNVGVDYDYIVVIDTEGLRAPELEDAGQKHDNELATGLSLD